MSANGESAPQARTLTQRLRPLAGLLILAIVFWFLPLGSSMTWVSPDDNKVTVPGEVIGDWRADEIEFAPEADWKPGDRVPPLLSDWTPGSEPVAIRLGESEDASGGSYSWTPTVLRVFRDIDLRFLGLTLLLFFIGNCLVVTRWWSLLRAIGLKSTWRNVFRLNFLGLFFNQVVPGLTGGDVIKTIIVVRESPGRRTDALVSVIVDRLMGLVALASLAAVVIFLVSGFEELQLSVVLFLTAAFTGTAVYFNRTVRRLIGFDALLAKLPLGDKLKILDDAVLLYSKHPRTIAVGMVLSLTNHLAYITGVCSLGLACGVPLTEVSWDQYLVIVPIANIITALPITPGGFGVGEALYVWLFGMIGARGSLGIAVSLTFRLCQMLLGLLGGVFLLMPGARAEVDSARDED